MKTFRRCWRRLHDAPAHRLRNGAIIIIANEIVRARMPPCHQNGMAWQPAIFPNPPRKLAMPLRHIDLSARGS